MKASSLIRLKLKLLKMIFTLSIILMWRTSFTVAVPLSISYLNQDESIKNEHFSLQKGGADRLTDKHSCLVNGSLYKDGENIIGAAGPCEECICHPPNVVCSMMKCPINSGCITIQLPNKCCPTYKCDCEHKGRLYNNGEKVDSYDESACRVCYCNGGEIVCTSIMCYTRNDCQGYYLPGDCCPKYDNCTLTFSEFTHSQKSYSKQSNIKINPHDLTTTETNYNEDSIKERDMTSSQQINIPTALNMGLSTSSEIGITRSRTTIQNNNSDDISIYNSTTEIMVSKLNVVEESTHSFLDFKTDILSTRISNTGNSSANNDPTDSTLQNTEPDSFSEIFDDKIETTTDIDNSVVITYQNGTESVVGVDEVPYISTEQSQTSTESTSTQVETFDPRDLNTGVKRPIIIEFSTVISEVNSTTDDLDDELFREATTPPPIDKSTVGVPHKLTLEKFQRQTEDEGNTEIIFTDLEDTPDMFGPNFAHRSNKLQTDVTVDNVENNTYSDSEDTSDMFGPNFTYRSNKVQTDKTVDNVENTTYSETTMHDNNKTKSNAISRTESSTIGSLYTNNNNLEDKITNDPITNQNPISTLEIINNNSLLNSEIEKQYSSTQSIQLTEVNDKSISEIDSAKYDRQCIDKNCTDSHNFNEDSSTKPQIKFNSASVPFIITAKAVPDKASSRYTDESMPYPDEYPEEFETIQNGPSVTITRTTYTSIPDVVYTTTTMVTLPTLDMIYKASEGIENYLLGENQTTTARPNNNKLTPLQPTNSTNTTN